MDYSVQGTGNLGRQAESSIREGEFGFKGGTHHYCWHFVSHEPVASPGYHVTLARLKWFTNNAQ